MRITFDDGREVEAFQPGTAKCPPGKKVTMSCLMMPICRICWREWEEDRHAEAEVKRRRQNEK